MARFTEAQTSEWFTQKLDEIGLSQAELSRQCGISTSDLSRYKSRKQYPRLDKVCDLADALQINVIELMVGLGVLDTKEFPTHIKKSSKGGKVRF